MRRKRLFARVVAGLLCGILLLEEPMCHLSASEVESEEMNYPETTEVQEEGSEEDVELEKEVPAEDKEENSSETQIDDSQVQDTSEEVSGTEAQEAVESEESAKQEETVETEEPVQKEETVESEEPVQQEGTENSEITNSETEIPDDTDGMVEVEEELSDIYADLVITTPAGLNAFASSVNSGNDYAGKVVVLGADIIYDYTDNYGFSPINGFSGTFNGRGHRISGISYDADDDLEDDAGLFLQINTQGIVMNVVMDGCAFEGDYVGIIAAYNNGIVNNCYRTGGGISFYTYGGGMVGYNTGRILNCGTGFNSFQNTIKLSKPDMRGSGLGKGANGVKLYGASSYYGGMVAYNKGTIANCYTIDRYVTEPDYAGGIVGHQAGGTVENCYTVGFESESGFSRSGDICGYQSGGTIKNVYYPSSSSYRPCASSTSAASFSGRGYDDMIGSELLNALNQGRGSNADWCVWTKMAGCSYPVHAQPGVMDTIHREDIASCQLYLPEDEYTYTGGEVRPDVTVVKNGDIFLKEGIDYTVSYADNVKAGTAQVIVTGEGTYTGTISKTFTINKLNQEISYTSTYDKVYGEGKFWLNAWIIQGDGTLSYTSSNIKVARVDFNTGEVLICGTGRAVISVTASQTEGCKAKTVNVTVNVSPKQQKISLTRLNGKKLLVKWKLDSRASGYEVQYSQYSNFVTGVKKERIKKATQMTKTLGKLKEGNSYYVRVASYKSVKNNGKTERLYGPWSEIKWSKRIKSTGFEYPKSITKCKISVKSGKYVYNGKKKKPTVTVKEKGKKLTRGADYSVTYKNNVKAGKATIIIKGKGKFNGQVTKTFKIKKASRKLKYTKKYTKTYGDKQFKLKVKVTSGKSKLTYSSSNKNVVTVDSKGMAKIKGAGQAVITVKAPEDANYKEASAKITITVKPKKQTASVKRQGKKTMLVKWKKSDKVSGYEIQYGTDGSFLQKKTVLVKKKGISSKKINKLTKGTTYYVRVRSYKFYTVNKKKKCLYGQWSNTKTVTI